MGRGSQRVFGREIELGPNPLPKAAAIVAVYFPDFAQSMTTLDLASDPYELWMFDAAEQDAAGGDMRALHRIALAAIFQKQTRPCSGT
jgi:hypothetical protein